MRDHLKGHSVTEAKERGWDRLANGDLLNAAEAAGLEVFVTADKNIRYQQNLTAQELVIGNAQWRVLRLYIVRVVGAVDDAAAGSYTEVDIPSEQLRRELN